MRILFVKTYKTMHKSKKVSKKGLTKGKWSGRIVELSRRRRPPKEKLSKKEKSLKIFEKVLDKEKMVWYNSRAVCERTVRNGHWKLNNKREVQSIVCAKELISSKSYIYSNKVKEAKINSSKDYNCGNADMIKIFREFDPGSGWTLAACITHSSRTELNRLILREASRQLSGGRVSNAWATCLCMRDNVWKRTLIPHNTATPHGDAVKDLLCRDGLASD